MNTLESTEVLPGGLIRKPLPNQKRRQRAHYIRPVLHTDGDSTWTTWDRTGFLPSDVEGRAYYEAKGFRLDPPEGTGLALHNTAVKEAIETELRTKLEAENRGIMETLMAEIASLKAKLEDKGTQDSPGKVGRPKKQVGG